MVTRIHALWGRSRKVLSLLVMESAVVMGLGVWALFATKPDPIPAVYPGIIGCQSGLSSKQSYRFAELWGGMVLFDTTIFALTVYKSVQFGYRGHRSIVDVLLRDGAIYFGVISTTGLCNVLTFIFGTQFSRGILTEITNILSSVTATRLMLNVRRRDQKDWLNGSLSIPTIRTSNISNHADMPSASAVIALEPSSRPERIGDPEE